MKQIHTEAEWEAVLAESEAKPVLVLKHSNICPVSGEGFRRVESAEAGGLAGPVYYLVVQESRPLSGFIAESLPLKHESPQVIVLRKGRAVYDTSHFKITEEGLAEAMRAAAGA